LFNVRGGTVLSIFFATLLIISFFNSLGSIAAGYQNSVSKAVYWVNAVQATLTDLLSQGIVLFSLYTLGIMLSGEERTRIYPKRQSIAVGYAAGFSFAAYIAVFYLVARSLFPVWVAPESGYSSMFGAKLPAFQLGLFAIDAALFEELIFRVLIPAFVARASGKVWIGALTGALLWGFAHSSYMVYPVWLRGVELSVAGLGLYWIYRRFGFAAAVIAHYVADCLLGGIPFFVSKDAALLVGFAAALAAVPAIAVLVTYADGQKPIRLRPHLTVEES
jgi:hypothetical protein